MEEQRDISRKPRGDEVRLAPQRRLLDLRVPNVPVNRLADLQACNLLLSTLPSRVDPRAIWEYFESPRGAQHCLELRHALSEHIDCPPLDMSATVASDRHEATIYRKWQDAGSGPITVCDLVDLVSALTKSSGTRFRRTPIGITSHDASSSIPMVDWQVAQERITRLPAMIESNELGNGILAAIFAAALVNNAHAFVDGNGRLGRLIFNYVLHRSGMPKDCYIPLKSLAVLSHGGYEISLRKAELFGQWEDSVAYYCAAIRLFVHANVSEGLESTAA